MKFSWYTPLIFGALVGFGAAMGVTTFCMMSEYSLRIAAYLRKLAERIEKQDQPTETKNEDLR